MPTSTLSLHPQRRKTCTAQIGNVLMGDEHPIVIQTMADVSTTEIDKAIAQTIRVAHAGAAMMRFTAQGVVQAKALEQIHKGVRHSGLDIPLVADIHFNPQAAFEALKYVEKVRINPGNFAELKVSDDEPFETFFQKAQQHVCQVFTEFLTQAKVRGRAIRIGVNHGSLSQRMLHKYGNTEAGMVESAMEYLRICQHEKFNNVVISMKSSNLVVMTNAVRLLVQKMQSEGMFYPLHLGVTEAGDSREGRIKSALGIGSLLIDGIGDTIRVSLSEPPEYEIPVAQAIVRHAELSMSAAPLPLNAHQPLYVSGMCHRKEAQAAPNFIGGTLPTPIIVEAEGACTTHLASNDFLLQGGLSVTEAFSERFGNSLKPIQIHAERIDETDWSALQKENEGSIIVLWAEGPNRVMRYRKAVALLHHNSIHLPIVLAMRTEATTPEALQIEASIDVGSLLLDGVGNGIYLYTPKLPAEETVSIALGILQAARLRFSHAEFISCPGCGRTLYNLQGTIAAIKKNFSHLNHLKIGIMGCIVNGPGEMADADYGYVGSTPGKIDLYKGQICMKKGVPQDQAVEELINLIKENGDWVEPTQTAL